MDKMTKLHKCLYVRQPFAESIAKGQITVHIMPRKTSYRGEVIVCAESGTGHQMGMMDGCMLAKAVLVDCIPVAAMTSEQVAMSDILTNSRKGWGWVLDNVRRIVEHPCAGSGFKDMEIDEDSIVEYPTLVMLDKIGFEMIMNGTWKLRRKKN